ncbi:MAG: succinate dehydrogenase iron-sulfur subunit [Candidatus Omnitrophica bacterium]|nr:succinate dehydrogenase iron-sulfur subunit [Candidatus Omnitrophota bacterium]
MEKKTVVVKIKRQEALEAKPHWEEYHIPYRPYLNVILLLQEIRKNPKTFDGTPTSPVAWESSCLEEVCGICTMVINGRVRQACSTLVDEIGMNVTIEPMRKFPVQRDLVVDRSFLFETLKRVKAWSPIDGTHNLGPGPRIASEEQQENYWLSRCFSCGCCLDVCPQVNDRSDFIGAMAINQVKMFNAHPIGKGLAKERLRSLMAEGGIEDCGNAQNCVKACPKEIPLVNSIAKINREITLNLLDLLKK